VRPTFPSAVVWLQDPGLEVAPFGWRSTRDDYPVSVHGDQLRSSAWQVRLDRRVRRNLSDFRSEIAAELNYREALIRLVRHVKEACIGVAELRRQPYPPDQHSSQGRQHHNADAHPDDTRDLHVRSIGPGHRGRRLRRRRARRWSSLGRADETRPVAGLEGAMPRNEVVARKSEAALSPARQPPRASIPLPLRLFRARPQRAGDLGVLPW
jgi:hypothetical protein